MRTTLSVHHEVKRIVRMIDYRGHGKHLRFPLRRGTGSYFLIHLQWPRVCASGYSEQDVVRRALQSIDRLLEKES